jgi:hypothetical protein
MFRAVLLHGRAIGEGLKAGGHSRGRGAGAEQAIGEAVHGDA